MAAGDSAWPASRAEHTIHHDAPPTVSAAHDSFSSLKSFLSGCAGGGAGKLVEYPMDTLKTVTQVRPDIRGPLDAVQRLGVTGLYRGLPVPLVAAILEVGTILSTSKVIKAWMHGAAGSTQHQPWHDFAAGGISGAIVAHILTPAELIKCRLQTGGYTSALDCLRRSVAAEGVRVLYKAHTATLIREIAGTAVWLGVYENCLHMMAGGSRSRAELTHLEVIAAGSIAGVWYWALPFPIDTVKTVMQTEAVSTTPAGIVSTARAIYARGGIRAFYRGLLPSLVRGAPGSAAILYTTELTLRMLDGVFPPNGTSMREWQEPEPPREASSGRVQEALGMGAAVAAVLCAPDTNQHGGWRGAR